MILYHWTPAANDRSIRAVGLDPIYSTGKRKCVWAASRSMCRRLRLHVALNHECQPEDLILFRVYVPQGQTRRSPWRGIYYVPLGVPAVRVFREPAASVAAILRRQTRNSGQGSA